MKILVCEDNKRDMTDLCAFISRFFKEINCPVEIITYDCGDALTKDLCGSKLNDVNIAFLEIYMPGCSGIDIAKNIRKLEKDMVIIFTTSSLDHGLDAFSVYAFQYLVKPIKYSQIKRALAKCGTHFKDSMRFIEVMSNRLAVRVRLADILYIEIFNHTCLIHTVSEVIKNYLPLDEIEKLIDKHGEHTFLRTHRSYIVNMLHINDITENDIVMSNGAMVPIPRNNKLKAKQAYTDYLFATTRGM